MAKKTTKKKTTKKAARKSGPRTAAKAGTKTSAKASAKAGSKTGGKKSFAGRGLGLKAGAAKGRHLVIVESPSKAKTINKYLGDNYLVVASVGHVRDLPAKNPKGVKAPVPGVDLDNNFKPSYEILRGKEKVMSDLKRAARESIASGCDIWFATDLDREGEAIAWHLAQELGIPSDQAKRVIFPAITKAEIHKAFEHPHTIDEDKVNAQQARRILDRIVGYQVSPLLWKKVARGLSAGRVQSVALRLVVEREREIDAFVPDEYWVIDAHFALSESDAKTLGPQWQTFLAETDAKGAGPTIKKRNAFLGKHHALRAELIEVDGESFDIRQLGGSKNNTANGAPDGTANRAPDGAANGAANGTANNFTDLTPRVNDVAALVGLTTIKTKSEPNDSGKGPAKWTRTVTGKIDPKTPYQVQSIETKRTTSRPAAPFITSTLQQAASSRLGFNARRTMRTAQSLYEGVDIPGEGPIGLITYMRTDSTTIAGEALSAVRDYISTTYGRAYLPDKPRFYSSSNKAAQEAHEAIRPALLGYPPQKIKRALTPDQLKLYTLIWERFVACQMMPAQWDSTAIRIVGGTDPKRPCTFKATGRVLVFDGFYRASGVPTSDEATLPALKEQQPVSPFAAGTEQKFTSPPARYSEASLIKTLESEGIGRPSTYADIIQKIQDRKYVEQMQRRFYATDLGEVVTDKLVEAFPRLMNIGYTRDMEHKLDQIEEDHLDWTEMLSGFYARFSKSLARAHEELQHAKAEIQPAPKEYRCEKCDSDLVYRFGKNGRFLSCSTYPDCNYACPIDRQGRPQRAEFVNVACPKTGRPMIRKTGRFGPFLATDLPSGMDSSAGIILNIGKTGQVNAPSQPPILTELPCPTCESPLNLRNGARGPWLGCSRFPKCRGRGKWKEIEGKQLATLEKALAEHDKANPIPIIKTLDGRALTDTKGKPLPDAPKVDELVIAEPTDGTRDPSGKLESVA